MEDKNDRRNNGTFGLMAVLLGTGTLIGRNAHLCQIRLVDKLLLVSFGAIIGALITRFFMQKTQ